jgi:hypothetical protein
VQARAVPVPPRTKVVAATNDRTIRRVDDHGRGRVGELATGTVPLRRVGMLSGIAEGSFPNLSHRES